MMAVTNLKKLPNVKRVKSRPVVFGVCATGDPRVDAASRERCVNIIEMVATAIAKNVVMPCGTPVDVVWSPVLIDGEKEADVVARQFRDAGVNAVVIAPDTWAFPQLTILSLLSQLPQDMPVNITCGNSGPKPGVVFAQAINGALAQCGRLSAMNVGTWPDTGINPQMTESTAKSLIDWCYAALTFAGLKGRRVLVFGHDSMGMETALAHVLPTRRTFGLEITRLDMKLLADMLRKGSYSEKELAELRGWIDKNIGSRLTLRNEKDSQAFNDSLAMYLIVRDLMAELNAVGGGFMSQLEWGSDRRGIPMPVADAMESIFNSNFDHNGSKTVMPFATEADVQGLLTMLFFTFLSGGNPQLFMDFRKVWEPWEIQAMAKKMKIGFSTKDVWAMRGFVDGNNSGSASFNWAGRPGETPATLMKRISMPLAEDFYFPGGGNSVAFFTPGGIEGIAGRMAYCAVNDRFSLIWDEAITTEMPEKLSQAIGKTSNITWPHTFIVPKYADMIEYKQYAPANHFHMTWNLPVARLQHWMDMTGVNSVAPWAARPKFIPNVDRPQPLLHLIGVK
ncbi:MAG TPA: hypothetical protein PKK48_00435 [Phycisphaerae bacterium]|nr:hypothetical protein [Phycisphaerae bacterium]